MFYDFAITIPADTLEAAPVTQVLKLTYGVIHEIDVLYPPGPHAMVKLRIKTNGHQLIPTNPDGYLASDDEVVRIPEYYQLFEAPYSLKAIAYSPGTTYPHTLAIRIGVLLPDVLNPPTKWQMIIQKIGALFGIR